MAKADARNQVGGVHAEGAAQGGLPTRGEVAKQLGVSVFKVRCMEGKELHPEVVGGVHVFDPEEVAAAAWALAPKRKDARPGLDDGEVAALAFQAFDDGRNLFEIVTQLRITPERVRALYREWSQPDLERYEVARRKHARAERERRQEQEEQRHHEKTMDHMDRDLRRLCRMPRP